MKIIDVHTHVALKSDFLAIDKNAVETPEENFWKLIKETEESGVGQVIIIGGLALSLSTEELLRMASGRNNIHIVAGIDIGYKNGYLNQLEGWLKSKKIIGVKFYPGYQHFYPSDERCLPIYKICQKYNIPAIYHSGDTLAGVTPNPKLKYSHPLAIDDIAADSPDLKIIIAHMGNPWLIDCAEVLYKNPNVYADISGLVVGDELHTSYGEVMKRRIGELVEYVRPEFKLLYGTDWPLCSMRPYIEFAKSLNLSDQEFEKLFFENAQKLFRL